MFFDISQLFVLYICFNYYNSTCQNMLDSIKDIQKQYETGENPVLVMCSDKNEYVCKYMRSLNPAYKLVCEFIGSHLVEKWNIRSPKMNLVKIKAEHWSNFLSTNCIRTAPALGYMMLNSVVDITQTTYSHIQLSKKVLAQLLKIALFDFWVANEDRTYNNANLLYDVKCDELVSIDYGGIFNTSTFEYPMCQLTMTDTILYAEIFKQFINRFSKNEIRTVAVGLEDYYRKSVDNCRGVLESMISGIPLEWKVDNDIILNKLMQLFDESWVDDVWTNFVECLNDNINE